uniref:ABC transmembrane type-1 domain-containing protein n=1 Tax=Elaeophora elaphi TaxID=1147741 RepID=A0A0R3RY74_9BILA
MVLFDLKTTLIRLSIYIITSDWLIDGEKKVLLCFIYQMVLAAVIVRTAIFAVIRMPIRQALKVLYQSVSKEVTFP